MKTITPKQGSRGAKIIPYGLQAPVIAIVGRPNVGKSTLFNQLTRSREAIVSDFPGLTRDRKYGTRDYRGMPFIWVDTGGLDDLEGAQGVESLMAGQALQAISESDLVMMVVDAKAGLTPGDEEIARHLRRVAKPMCLVINKVDGKSTQLLQHEFYSLGFGTTIETAAVHGRGIDSLQQTVYLCFSDRVVASEADRATTTTLPNKSIKVAIVGRPNVGKSTLMNRMLGDERSVVFDLPGTTRDSIYEHFERRGQDYTLIDTAGMRRRGKIEQGVERFSVVKTLAAISDAHVVILLIDASEGLVDQDLHLLGFVLDAGKAAVLACNKWDGLGQDQRSSLKSELDRRLNFADYLDVHFISALHGTGVGHLYQSVNQAYASASTQVKTPILTAHLERAVSTHQPPLVRGRRIKLRYAHMGGVCPPRIVIHGNQTDAVPKPYKRYLQNYFRKALSITGTPIHFEFKTGKNPYEGRVNKLSARQIQKKRRLMRFVKS